MNKIDNDLFVLSKDIVETIEREDKEYDFKKNKGYVERNVLASQFKKNIVGLNASDFSEIISNP